MPKVKVFIIESERGYGQRVDETKEFDSRQEAEAFARDYNREHNPPKAVTPGWYMYARVEGQEPFSGMLR